MCAVAWSYVCSIADTLQQLQLTATHRNILQHTYESVMRAVTESYAHSKCQSARYNTLQHTATYCNTLQHTATHCNALQHIATHCNALQHAATHCNTLQHTATHCNTLQHTATHCLKHTTTHCTTLRHNATHCCTLQHTATLVIRTGAITSMLRSHKCVPWLIHMRAMTHSYADHDSCMCTGGSHKCVS